MVTHEKYLRVVQQVARHGTGCQLWGYESCSALQEEHVLDLARAEEPGEVLYMM